MVNAGNGSQTQVYREYGMVGRRAQRILGNGLLLGNVDGWMYPH